jgi:hypothetical protein
MQKTSQIKHHNGGGGSVLLWCNVNVRVRVRARVIMGHNGGVCLLVANFIVLPQNLASLKHKIKFSLKSIQDAMFKPLLSRS